MNKIYSTLLLLFFGLTLMGQDIQNTLANSRYLIFDLSVADNGTDFPTTIDLTDLQSFDIIIPQKSNERFIDLPFYGQVKFNRSGDITHLKAEDPLRKYGYKEVRLSTPIQVSRPYAQGITTSYQLTMGPGELSSNFLNQLPIRPDSVRVVVQSIFTDQPRSQVTINRNSSSVEVESFSRQVEVDRRVEVKIAPFGWESVNDISPMLDWDQSYQYQQIVYWKENLLSPFAINEKRNGDSAFALLDQQAEKEKQQIVSGVPSIKAVPNPAINDLRFEINNVTPGSYTIRVKNILGEQKIEKTIEISSSDIIPIDIDSLRKGSYFYILEDDEGNVISTKRLIVLRP